ncbi:MAG: phosphoribosyl-AMP cyclohydrolase [Thermomicrobiales bacterium]
MNQDLLITFDQDGLVPVVVQDLASGEVLMIAFMNEDALEATRRTGRSHFWSRSRGKLWRKGETSGHEQIVDEILINCERNSLLLKVHQIGVVCHEGYATCFYRALETDNTLTIQRDRIFDPASVYGDAQSLESLTTEWFNAYQFLYDHNFTALSKTSERMRDRAFDPNPRIGDELRELAGVLDGSHAHGTPADDVLLEGTQVLYWIVISALRAGLCWSDVRPDRALETTINDVSTRLVAELLRQEADNYNRERPVSAAALHSTIAIVGQACHAMGVEPRALLLRDLAELHSKQYLADYFAGRSTIA